MGFNNVEEADDSMLIIILESVEQTVGILVDSVAEVEDVVPEEYDQAQPWVMMKLQNI